MKIVIDIPEEDYKFIKDLQFYNSGRRNGKTIERNVINGIRNGTPYEERPTGEWITEDVVKPYGICNQCGEICEVNNFCGNCGAEMKGGTE